VRPRTVAEDLQMFSQVLNQIRVNHPDSVDMHRLFMAAIEGLVGAVDPHSYVLPAARLSPEREREFREGRLLPVPITFAYIGGAPVVVSVAQGSAAASLDIMPGDELVAIDGAPVAARSAQELAITLAGRGGTAVALIFERQRLDGTFVELVREVRREQVEAVTAVPAAFMLDASTGYIRITHFLGDKVADDLRDALVALERRGMARLLIDLRDNGGGNPYQAARIAGEFLPRGAVVYTAEGRKEDVNETVRVQRSFFRRGERTYPIILLVNRGTASAAELLAGALQDHDRALIAGRPTFGKALLARGFPLADGSTVVLTIGHVKTPCGRIVQRQYRDVSEREYYRLARAERDTVGLPACRTAAGRLVYGGGGIRPDVILPEPAATPLWLARLVEENVPLKWIGGFLSSAPELPDIQTLESVPALPQSILNEFRDFARRQGADVPDGADADARLERLLLGRIARTRSGEPGFYKVAALLDPEVAAAMQAFETAAAILAGRVEPE
jgi:carboxyl-terminal processing protease